MEHLLELAQLNCDAEKFKMGIKIANNYKKYFITVYLFDEYALKNNIFVWPSHEFVHNAKIN